MRLLLDTHTLVWAMQGGDRLTPTTRERIQSRATPVYVSVASIWELAIKATKGKFSMPPDVPGTVADAGFIMLDIKLDHALAAANLSLHHRDPFDRMLVAQAITEDMVLVTRDATLPRYGVSILAA
ncbi:MAG: type II toxin-antitoxin system VapC family toxin [Reyranellaceae bacterium]